MDANAIVSLGLDVPGCSASQLRETALLASAKRGFWDTLCWIMSIRRLAVYAATLLLFSGVAFAKPKVVLLAFSGDPKEEARRAVSAAIADDVRFVKRKDVKHSFDKLELDAEDLAEKDLRSLASELEADAIIQASFSKKPPNRVLHFKLFVHGKKVTGFTIEFGSLKSRNFKEQLRDKLVAKLSEEGGADTASSGKRGKKAEGDDEATSAKAGKGDRDNTDDILTPMKGKAKRTDDGDADKAKASDKEDSAGDKAKKKRSDADDGDDREKRSAEKDEGAEKSAKAEATATPVRAANRAALRLDVGVSGHKRTMSFNSRSFPEAPKNFSNGFVPGIRVEAEVYPLAFTDPNSLLAGIGLGGVFDQTLLLKVTPDSQPDTKLPVTERHYSIGPRFRYVFGDKSTSPSVTASIGYGHRSYVVKRSALMNGNTLDLPDVDYAGFEPGVQARIPLGERFAVVVGASALLLTSAGAIEKPDQYGQAKVLAGQAVAGVDIAITNRFAVRLAGEFAQFGFTFKGTGAQANARDMDPSTNDVGGATDRYFGGVVTFAVQY